MFVERMMQGDQRSFEVLYQRYYPKVLAIARGILLDADEATDAVQEIFTLVHRHIKRFDRRSRFSTWLFRIAVNRSIQSARKLKYKARQVELKEAMERAADDAHEVSSDPRIAACLAKMQPTDRALLTLFYWEELSLQEVGESIGCSANAAKTRLFRARERFRELFEEEQS